MTTQNALPTISAGVHIHFSLGQRVFHDGMPGRITALSLEEEVIMALIVLDEPFVLPAETLSSGEKLPEMKIYRQHVPVHRLQPA